MRTLTLIPFFTFALSAWSAPITAENIMKKNEEIRQLPDVTSSATLTTGAEGGQTRVKDFTWWRKLTSDGVHYNTLTRFHKPAEIKGEGILFLEHEGDQSDVLLYLPSFKKIRRVERNSQSGSFMGSEFSYADIATPHFADFNFKLLKEESCPNAGAEKCWVVESTPKREETRERTGYSRSKQWIHQSNFMMDSAEHYNKENVLVKKITASNTKEVDAQNHKWMSLNLRVDTLATRKFTTLEFRSVKANSGLADALFTQQNLSKP